MGTYPAISSTIRTTIRNGGPALYEFYGDFTIATETTSATAIIKRRSEVLKMTAPKHLQPYSGPLSSSEIAAGMNAATRNAERLAKDARLLFDNERYASSAALAILSIEESGKARILRELALARHERELRECWREYRTHTKKNLLWPIVEMFLKGARRAGDFGSLLKPDAEHPYVLDKLKQISIYTDSFEKGYWSVPEQIVEKELAESLLVASEVLSQRHDVKAEEIDLWIQYLQPYWKTSSEACQQALFEWDKEMRKRGLLKGKTTMEKFFITGIDPTNDTM